MHQNTSDTLPDTRERNERERVSVQKKKGKERGEREQRTEEEVAKREGGRVGPIGGDGRRGIEIGPI